MSMQQNLTGNFGFAHQNPLFYWKVPRYARQMNTNALNGHNTNTPLGNVITVRWVDEEVNHFSLLLYALSGGYQSQWFEYFSRLAEAQALLFSREMRYSLKNTFEVQKSASICEEWTAHGCPGGLRFKRVLNRYLGIIRLTMDSLKK